MVASLRGVDVLTYDSSRESSARSTAVSLLALCALVAAINPGILVGAVTAFVVMGRPQPRSLHRWAVSMGLAGCLVVLHSFLLLAWPWRIALGHQLTAYFASLTPLHFGWDILPSLGLEALAGPLLLQVFGVSATLISGLLTWQLRWQRRADKKKQHAVIGPRLEPGLLARGGEQPDGTIRLGLDRQTRRHIDLDLSELAEHVFLPGASGSGKTTTLSRLSDGVLSTGLGLIIIDCKGGDLKQVAADLAKSHDLPFHLIDPDDPESLLYDPCSGGPSDVSNKLVGVFNYADAAEIYRLASMRVLPILVRALRAANQRVTLDTIVDCLLSPGAMERLGRQAGEPLQTRLNDLADDVARDKGGILAQGHLGLGLRFGALLEGKFGPLFPAKPEDSTIAEGDGVPSSRPILDWDQALSRPAVTYLALRATANSEDVELMGRIIAQDLKQVCSRRIQALAADKVLVPTLLVIDEFAALREAEQFVDLLLQARQARMPTVLSTQYVPETVKIRKAALEAGLIISHRLETEDAQIVAAQFGTRKVWDDTLQLSPEGASGWGSARRVDEYHIHPNDLRDMKRGYAALRSIPGDRRTIVQVYKREGG